jgi:sodium/hydrogen antiporter
MYETLAILALFVFLYSITSGGLERTPINGAVVFIAFGLVFGPLGLDFLRLDVDAEGVRTLAELTLALILFIDAANADLGILKKFFEIPTRLLLFALPLIILLGFGVGVVIFEDLTLIEIAILATLLAPTDAALGKAVVTNQSVPQKIREGLNVESGLNDGICVPVLFVFLALAAGSSHGHDSTTEMALMLVAEEIGIGAIVGLGITAISSWIMLRCKKREWITEIWRQVAVPALAVACFACAQAIGGSGFIACFVGGMLFGWIAKDRKHDLLLAAEGTGETLALITWVVFGAAVITLYIDHFSIEIVIYSILSLTVIRMLPVFLVLGGLKLRADEKLFIGWFGPRGLASIVFAVIVLNHNLPGGKTIVLTAVCTILLSVIGHGLSANPLVAAMTKKIKT